MKTIFLVHKENTISFFHKEIKIFILFYKENTISLFHKENKPFTSSNIKKKDLAICPELLNSD